MKIMFHTAVRVPEGIRSAIVVAFAEPVSKKRVRIVAVESFDHSRGGFRSLSGARLQVFTFKKEEAKLIGKIKNLSSCIVLECNDACSAKKEMN